MFDKTRSKNLLPKQIGPNRSAFSILDETFFPRIDLIFLDLMLTFQDVIMEQSGDTARDLLQDQKGNSSGICAASGETVSVALEV